MWPSGGGDGGESTPTTLRCFSSFENEHAFGSELLDAVVARDT